MNRQPINLDDPRLTDFSLGEMSLQESKEFKQQLCQSPLAQRELDAMEDIMAQLTDGLRGEWADRPEVPSSLELVVADTASKVEKDAAEEQPVVVPMSNFSKSAPSRAKMLSLAAVLTGMLVVGSLVLNLRDNTGRNFAASSSPVSEKVVVESVSVDRGGSESVNIPSLLLAEEVTDFDVVVADLNRPVLPLDDSYLDGGAQIIKTSYQGGVDSAVLRELSGANSYLGLAENDSTDIQLSGMKSEIVSNKAGKGRMKTYTRSGSWSGSGRLGLISDYSGMQADVAEVLQRMESINGSVSATQAAQIRAELRNILTQSKEIGSQLAH